MGQFDAVMSNPASRRNFLKGVGVLGASGVLAACRKNVQASGSGATSSIGPIESECHFAQERYEAAAAP